MAEFSSEERIALRRLINIYPQLLDLIDPLRPIQPPQPAPVPTLVKMDLCDTVEAYLKTYSHIGSIYVLEEALTAERKRQELVDELIRVAKTHYHKADNLDRAIQALDAFDKERG